MATSDDRRNVAKALRDSFLDPTDELEAALLHAFGHTRDDAECFDFDYGAMLADLIDPTCEMKSLPTSSYRVCSRCGAFVRKDAVTNCTEVIQIRFCPNCRARIES